MTARLGNCGRRRAGPRGQQAQAQQAKAQQPKQAQAQLSKNQKLRLAKQAQGEERKKPLPHVDVEAAVPAEPVQQVRSAK